MMRAARLAIGPCLIVCAALQPAAADGFYREDLRIPLAAAGPRGLEAMLLRPSGTRRYPLALISHGAPRDAADRADDVALRLLPPGAANSRGAVLPPWS